MAPFNVTAEQAAKLHQLWNRHRDDSNPESTFGAFVNAFQPVLMSDGGIGGQIDYRTGGGIFICILPDGSAHS